MKTPDINLILRLDPRSCKYGAPMGARDYRENESPLYLQRLRLVDYNYGADGTYWGCWSRKTGGMYCAFNEQSRVYIRAKNRNDAAAMILEDYPDARFFRGTAPRV